MYYFRCLIFWIKKVIFIRLSAILPPIFFNFPVVGGIPPRKVWHPHYHDSGYTYAQIPSSILRASTEMFAPGPQVNLSSPGVNQHLCQLKNYYGLTVLLQLQPQSEGLFKKLGGIDHNTFITLLMQAHLDLVFYILSTDVEKTL